jgi:hypothetical protein
MYSNMLLGLKKMVLILEYLAKDVANATTFVGMVYLMVHLFETKFRCYLFIVFVNLKSCNCLGLAFSQHLLDLINPN